VGEKRHLAPNVTPANRNAIKDNHACAVSNVEYRSYANGLRTTRMMEGNEGSDLRVQFQQVVGVILPAAQLLRYLHKAI
jgi:hypothetical protein